MKNKSLIIIRHGRSQYNVKSTNDLDSDLTEFGERQATIVGQFLRSKFGSSTNFKVHTSPFLRCFRTAKCMNFPWPISDWRLREYVNLGLGNVEVFPKYEMFDNQIDIGNSCAQKYIFEPESNEVFFNRIQSFYNDLNDMNSLPVIVTHGLPALQLAHIATSDEFYVPCWNYGVNNCSITWIDNGVLKWRARNLHYEY